MRVLLLFAAIHLTDPFENFLCELSRRGQLDCTHGNARCAEIQRLCPSWWERKRMPKELRT